MTEVYPIVKVLGIGVEFPADPFCYIKFDSFPYYDGIARVGYPKLDELMDIRGYFHPTDEMRFIAVDGTNAFRVDNSLMYVTEGGGARNVYFISSYKTYCTPCNPEGSGNFTGLVVYERKNWLLEQGVEIERSFPTFDIQDDTQYSTTATTWATFLQHDLGKVRNTLLLIYTGLCPFYTGYDVYQRVQYSEDGKTWITIAIFSQDVDLWRYYFYLMGAENMRYIRYQMYMTAGAYMLYSKVLKAYYFYK